MNLSIDSFIDDLVARRTVEEYDTFSIVQVPGFSALTDSERTEVIKKIQQQQTLPLLNADALRSALRCITPPVDKEAGREKSRLLEAQAREELEDDGCPPCYPPYLEIPLRNVPEQYKAIVSYWESFPSTCDVVLRAQLSDWRKFRSYQGRIRQHYRQIPFSEFLEKVRKRREKHNLRGNVHLRFDVRQQNRLEYWTEFQDYHLQLHENLEKEREDLKKFSDLRIEAEDTSFEGFERPSTAYQYRLEYTEQKLRWHETLLQWATQERMAMDISYPVPAEKYNDGRNASPKVDRGACSGSRQKRRRKTPSILGDVKILKAESKRLTGPRRKRTTSKTEFTIEDSAAASESSIHQVSRRRQVKPRPNKIETSLRQRRPQKVSKAERFAHANAKSPARPTRRAGHKRSQGQAPSKSRQPLRWSKFTSEAVSTRSGRVSRRPMRWAPE